MLMTLSVLKADVGSIGGHTKPSDRMMDVVKVAADAAIKDGLLIDAFVGHTGDDICITTSHTNGADNTDVHQFAWNTFLKATEIAKGSEIQFNFFLTSLTSSFPRAAPCEEALPDLLGEPYPIIVLQEIKFGFFEFKLFLIAFDICFSL